MKQTTSADLSKLRLISYDLRGHGDSDNPLVKEAYHNPEKWAQDLQSVIRASCAVQPCIVAWSYGGRVINDYLSVFGDAELSAIDYVAATSTGERFWLGRSYALLVPMLSDDPAVAVPATRAFLKACFEKQASEAELQ
ncbi:MAG: alpha/beta hydrolase [Candidatus Protistobacter heckmanni]|nr:alpha/beta hydrolase [Candidatus Protistobacter heckmanni]